MKTILLVEDDKGVLEVMQLVLETYGYEVVAAQNGQIALEWLKSGVSFPSLILLDLMMPVMDGIGFLEQQIKDPTLSSIPVIVMSAYSNFEHKVQKSTVVGCLKKPVDIDHLIEFIKRFSK